MKALAPLFFWLIQLSGYCQDTELDSLAHLCPCIDDGNLAQALKSKHKTPILGRGNLIQIKCDGRSYFFLIPPRSRFSESIFLNANKEFESNDRITSSGYYFFKVKINDKEDMQYNFDTKCWEGPHKIPDSTESLGGDHF